MRKRINGEVTFILHNVRSVDGLTSIVFKDFGFLKS